MATKAEALALPAGEASRQLADQWRRLTRAATFVALLSSPAVFAWFYGFVELSFAKSILATFFLVIAFRGLGGASWTRPVGDLSLQAFASEADAERLAASLNPKSTALFFEKRDFAAELDRPLAETLSRTNALALPITIGPVESIKIDRLTRPHLFTFDFQPLQEGSAVIVLAPIRAAG